MFKKPNTVKRTFKVTIYDSSINANEIIRCLETSQEKYAFITVEDVTDGEERIVEIIRVGGQQ